MQLAFLGATRQVTGSMFLLTTEGRKNILIDCGLYQGSRVAEDQNYEPFAFDPKQIDAVILTHAHLDHVGRLPKLVKEGFRGPIFATAATADLVHLVLLDAQKLIEDEATKQNHEPLFSVEDVNHVMRLLTRVEYGITTTASGITFSLLDAGHILGSSIIEITDSQKKIVFSGDLGNPGTPILKPTQVPSRAQVVVMESTYGSRVHEPIGQRENILRQTIVDTIKNHGVLLIPAFAIERTQELLYEIDQLQKAKMIPQVPIFLDSPLAINATTLFERYSQLWNHQSRKLKAAGDDFFHFPGLVRTITVQDSKQINDVSAPKVIIAGSGMMEGGRILHHLKRYLPNEHSTLLVVGYQAKGTLGREVLDGAKRVKIHGDWIDVRAKIKPIGAYSAHADGPALVEWLSKFDEKPKHVYLVHGEPDEMAILAQNIKEKLQIDVIMPEQGQTVGI